jgi:uncharacterized UBP type Zn finger protein
MIEIKKPEQEVICKECSEKGEAWVHLRMCMTCGYIGCCDSSRNKHARKHYVRKQHPIIRSVEAGENWVYCYIDDEMLRS